MPNSNVIYAPFGHPRPIYSECGKFASFPFIRRALTLDECEATGDTVGTEIYDSELPEGKFIGVYSSCPLKGHDWACILMELEYEGD